MAPTRRPVPIGSKTTAVLPPRKPVAARAPERDSTDDVLDGAFGEPVQKPAQQPAAVRRPFPPGSRKPDMGEVAKKFGTKGMPDDVARSVGAKGSEVFGAPPSKSGETDKPGVAPPKAPVASGPAQAGTGRRLPPAVASRRPTPVASKKPQEVNEPPKAPFMAHVLISDTGEATRILEATWKPFAELSDEEKAARNAAFETIIRDREARREMLRAILAEEDDIEIPPVCDEQMERQANRLAEGLTRRVFGEAMKGRERPPVITGEDGAEPFEGEDSGETGEAGVPARYKMPTGLVVTLDELTNYILSYVRAKSYTKQGDIDRALGTTIGKLPNYPHLKSETQPETMRAIAERMALALVESLQPTPPPDDRSASADGEDDGDDGSEPETDEDVPVAEGGLTVEYEETGRAFETARRRRFEDEKASLRTRAQNLTCYKCNKPAPYHKGLKGAGIAGNTCTGFVAQSNAQRDALMALLRDTEAFKSEYADLRAEQKVAAGDAESGRAGTQGDSGSFASNPDSERVVRRGGENPESVVIGGASAGPSKSGGVGGGARPATGGHGVSGAENLQAAREHELEGRGHEGRLDRDPAAGTQRPLAGGDERPQDGPEFTPAEFRDAAEGQRRDWAAECGDELTGKLAWSINYPPGGAAGADNLATPFALAADSASAERRGRIVTTVANFLDKAMFGKAGQLRENYVYGSCSYRVFLAARKLARECENYAASRTAEDSQRFHNAVERAARDYVAAHVPPPSGDEEDIDFATYVDWCAEARKPVGTPIEQLEQLET